MIKIKRDDTIISIIDKIKNYKGKEIILNFPFSHPILHNYLSLKIIKAKSGKRPLIIVTNDLTSKKIGKRLGIKYSIIKDTNFLRKDENNNDILKYNFTFWEYFKFILKKYIKDFLNIILQNREINKLSRYSKKYENKYNLGFFVLSLIISIILFLFIFYFAVNKTYIYITPEISIKTKAKNFIFANIDNSIIRDNNIIEIKQFSEVVNIKKDFITTGIDPSSTKKSKGKVKFINKYNKEIKLLPNTRLLTKDGILYQTKNRVTIPASSKDNFGKITPGTKVVNIVAKDFDIKGKFIGKRGNIKGKVILTLPGLKTNDLNIYAETIGEIKGGNNSYKKVLLKEDLENAKKIMEDELKKEALKKLKESLEKKNKIDNSNWDILGINNIIKYSNQEIKGIKKLKIGENIDSFSLEGKIIIHTHIYNKNTLINKLKNLIKSSIIKGSEKILSINKQSLRISNIIYKTNKPFRVKATAEIEFFVLYDFSNKQDNYTKKLKNLIRGLNKEEAKKILINESKISNSEIIIRPFFMKKVSNILSNIIFKITED